MFHFKKFKKRYADFPVALINETYVQVQEIGQFQLNPARVEDAVWHQKRIQNLG